MHSNIYIIYKIIYRPHNRLYLTIANTHTHLFFTASSIHASDDNDNDRDNDSVFDNDLGLRFCPF